MKRLRKILILLILLLAPTLSTAQTPTTGDSFDGNAIDKKKWEVSESGTGSVAVRDGRLRVTVKPTTRFKPFYMVGLQSRWKVSGDFDMEVSYRIVKWSPESRVRVGLCVQREGDQHPHKHGGCVERVGKVETFGGPQEVYLTHFREGVSDPIETGDQEGRLRLTRVGGRMTGFYDKGGRWVAVHTGEVSPEPFIVGLGIWGHYSNPGVAVTFDDFTVHSGTVLRP